MKDMNVGPSKNKPAKARRNPDEAETVSDAEDAENEGGDDDHMMQDDEDDSDADYEDAGEGLKSRYSQALRDTQPNDEDFSFARYMHKANIG
jgi:hypothetical protein